MNIKVVLEALVLSILLLLVGCATEENYKAALNMWLNNTPLDLVRSWGPPEKTYELDGHKFLVYYRDTNVHFDGTPPTYTTQFVGDKAYTTVNPGLSDSDFYFSCTTTFEVVDNKIVSWRYEGNDCTL